MAEPPERRAAIAGELLRHATRNIAPLRGGGALLALPGEDDAGVSAEVGAGEHGVTDPLDLQPAQRPQRRLHRVGQRRLAARHRGRVDQGAGQREDVGGQVELRRGAHDCRAYGPAPRAADRSG